MSIDLPDRGLNDRHHTFRCMAYSSHTPRKYFRHLTGEQAMLFAQHSTESRAFLRLSSKLQLPVEMGRQPQSIQTRKHNLILSHRSFVDQRCRPVFVSASLFLLAALLSVSCPSRLVNKFRIVRVLSNCTHVRLYRPQEKLLFENSTDNSFGEMVCSSPSYLYRISYF